MSDKEEPKLHFRGGVRYMTDNQKWHIVIEVNGTQYLEADEYDTEEEAMVVYRAVRESVMSALGVVIGKDIEFNYPVTCSLCKMVFTTFLAYNGHLPCPSAPPE